MRWYAATFRLLLVLLAAGTVACSPAPRAVLEPPDAVALPGGKADGTPWSPCALRAMVAWLNDPEVDEAALRGAGVHARAARNLLARRDGPDGVAGTFDDAPFADAAEVDAVPYVGPITMGRLVEAAGGCSAGEPAPDPVCVEQEALAFLNDPEVDEAALRGAGVHARAARNLLARRDGPDGVAGTLDDAPFASWSDVDAVPQVGPSALAALRRLGEARCVPLEVAPVRVLFSPRPWEESQLAQAEAYLHRAERSIDVAMYHLRDGRIRAALRDAVARGVRVRLLLDDARLAWRDPAGSIGERLERDGIEVRWVNKILHHKFFLVDGPQGDPSRAAEGVLGTGSANWTQGGGTRYDENTLFAEGHRELNLRFQREFDRLWEGSRPFGRDIDFFQTPPVEPDWIEAVDRPDVDVWFTSDNFDRRSGSLGPTFVARSGSTVVSDRLVALIESAGRRILVASGHLRSRPIAEALMDKARRDPHVDIRIVVDTQDYLSRWAHERQLRRLRDCLDRAGDDERAAERCRTRGFLFGYAMHEAGVPIRFKYYAYRWHYSYAKLMHHKFAIVDDKVATGSYNYSDTAERDTFENVVLFDGRSHPEALAAFVAEFERLWSLGRAEGRYEALLSDVREGDDSFPIVFEPMSLSWPEVDALRRSMREACPDIDSPEFRDNPGLHRVCLP